MTSFLIREAVPPLTRTTSLDTVRRICPFISEVRRQSWELGHSRAERVPVVKLENQGKTGLVLLFRKVEPFMHHKQHSAVAAVTHS